MNNLKQSLAKWEKTFDESCLVRDSFMVAHKTLCELVIYVEHKAKKIM